MKRILYICNHTSNHKCSKTYCRFLKWGYCEHTTKRDFSLNWKDREPTEDELKEKFGLFYETDKSVVYYELLKDLEDEV